MPERVATTLVLLENELVLYRRGNSTVWQCRYKVDGIWQRATTKERDIKKAKTAASKCLLVAQIRKHENIPVVTRKFRDIARLALERMDKETTAGKGMASFVDYKRVIDKYLVPYFGKLNITSIDYAVLEQFDAWRVAVMEKEPTRSTLLTHNAALNRVFDEAETRGFLTAVNRPKLEAKGKKSNRRPAFEMNEVRTMLRSFGAWVEQGRDDKSKELRQLLKDYVIVLLDTGARPGVELMNLQWKQIKFTMRPITTETDTIAEEEPSDAQPEKIVLSNLNRGCMLSVSGKTGRREAIARQPTVKALVEIARRNYGIADSIIDPFKTVQSEHGDECVFRSKDKKKPTSFQSLFETFLKEHSLFTDAATGQGRVLYSLRHTYATFMVQHDDVNVYLLAEQMGTSVQMIEKHYGHLNLRKAAARLAGEEMRRLMATGSIVDD